MRYHLLPDPQPLSSWPDVPVEEVVSRLAARRGRLVLRLGACEPTSSLASKSGNHARADQGALQIYPNRVVALAKSVPAPGRL